MSPPPNWQCVLRECWIWGMLKSVAAKFEDMLRRQFQLWNHWLIGYDCWPYEQIDIKVVGFAVRDASLLDWNDDSLGKIYEGVLDQNGVPQCPDECYKHLGQLGAAQTTGAKFADTRAPAKRNPSTCRSGP
ncbi:unnamed protein product [Phytophthora lilii]|uniref:Unnamed protein product n=1 Tax=Phytophthora lilii TaxID=2077276 RepID=A0A9W6YK41_9STRA|nr:unnamed protein product [Phytophthora lilii]